MDSPASPIPIPAPPAGLNGPSGLLLPGIAVNGRLNSNHYLLNAVSDGVLSLDLNARISYANTTACRLLGYPRELLVGQAIEAVMAEPVASGVESQSFCDPVLRNGELFSTDTTRFRRRDGGLFQALLTAIPVIEAPGTESSQNTAATERPVAGVVLVFREVAPGRYLNMPEINQLLTHLMTRQGARSTIAAALAGVTDIVQADFAVMGLYEKDTDSVCFDTLYNADDQASRDSHAAPEDADFPPLRMPARATPYGYIYQNAHPVCINDYAEHSLSTPEFLRRGARSLLATPILAENRLMGVAYFFRRQDRPTFTDTDLENVRSLGTVLSAALFKADHESRLTELATTDPLTGLLNRRAIFQRVRSEIDRANRYGTPFSALMLDLDFFKELNDAYGHLAGDQVLCEIARALTEHTRRADAVARAGGEEFLILLPQTDLDGAIHTAEKIRGYIQQLQIPVPEVQEKIGVTISIGCAQYSKGESCDELYGRLDRLLYRSKFSGRNRISHS